MKKVLIFSDVHGYLQLANKVINKEKPDEIIFLGDWGSKDRSILYENNVEYIAGNNLYEEGEKWKIIDIDNLKIFITHGHYFSTFSEYVSNKKIIGFINKNDLKIDLILHGHTHVKKDESVNGYRIVNPGSLSDPRDDSKGSYIIMNIKNGEFSLEFKFI